MMVQSERLSYYAATFSVRKWVGLSALVAPETCEALVALVGDAPARRVSVGNHREHWTEHDLTGVEPLKSTLASAGIISLVEGVLNEKFSGRIQFWAQSYTLGEYIPWHRDGAGSIQLMLNLRAVPRENGGVFMIRSPRQELLPMRTGDAILFDATAIEHATSPLTSSSADCAPRRVTAVARFYQ